MKINKITLTNFRQYYGENTIDLTTSDEKNIILIGGKNGYGKTNFLLSLVWCLYGEDIIKIDENFRHEIKKDGNYSKFLKSSLNWDAVKEGVNRFSVEIFMSGIELPEMSESKHGSNYSCNIKRSFDSSFGDDDLEIKIEGIKESLFNSMDDKINFINDYLIPLEAAKFVFFDAEKIASWAELSTKEEGSVLNDALGKILGLDIYEALINDLNIYTDGLRKDSATALVRQQIISTEKGIELNVEKMDALDTDIVDRENDNIKLKSEIVIYETLLARRSNKFSNTATLDELYEQRNALKIKERELESKFHELCEVIPFALAAGKFFEVTEHIKMQEERIFLTEKRNEFIEKNNELIERLFNNPPFPNDGDISFSKKVFYADKAKKIVEDVFGRIDDLGQIEFEHDFSKSEMELIHDTFNHTRKQSKDVFEQTITNFERVKSDIVDVDRLIRKIESDLEDEEVIEYSNKKNEAERKVERLIEEKGALQSQREALRKDNERLNQSMQLLLKKISVSEKKKKKLDKANQYIKSLEAFIIEQKSNKCASLEVILFDEMKKLMHKLNDVHASNFIAAVKAEALPGNDGLKITLYDKEGGIRAKESLSQGEKQIYISSLIKAIFSLSIQEYPIFIDTPLGRLDDEHIKQILLYYYPDLSHQVVVMATNNEIPPSRFKLVKDSISQAYLLENSNNRTKFKQGYFQSYEN